MLAICVWLTSLSSTNTDTLVQVVVIPEVQVMESRYESPVKEIALDKNKTYSNGHVGDLLQTTASATLRSYGLGLLATPSIRGSNAAQVEVTWNDFKLNDPGLGTTDLSTVSNSGLDEIRLIPSLSKIQLVSSVPQKTRHNRYIFGVSYGSFRTQQYQFGLVNRQKAFTVDADFNFRSAENNFPYLDPTTLDGIEKRTENAQQLGLNGMVSVYIPIDAGKQQLSVHTWYNQFDRNLPPPPGLNANEQQYDRFTRNILEWKYTGSRSLWEAKLAYFDELRIYQNELIGLFAENRFNTTKAIIRNRTGLGNWFFDASVSMDYYQVNASGISDVIDQTQLTPKLEIGWHSRILNGVVGAEWGLLDFESSVINPFVRLQRRFIEKRLSATLLLSRNTRWPTLNDWYWRPGGNLDIVEEISWNGELDLEFQAAKTKHLDVSISARPYYRRTDNWIQWVPNNTGIWSARNLKDVESMGLETNLHWLLHYQKFVAIGGNHEYAYNQSQVVESETGVPLNKQLIYVPQHKFTSSAYLHIQQFYFQIMHVWSSRSYTSDDESSFLPSYSTIDLNVGNATVVRQSILDIGFSIRNITDKEYYLVANRPLPGRSFEVYVKFNFAHE